MAWFFGKTHALYYKLIKFSDATLSPLLDLGIRLYMANIFFKSGQLKLNNYMNGQWENTVVMFSDYHPIPGIEPQIAAVAGTTGEVILPVLLAIGLFGRIGAAGLLVMTLIIQFGIPGEYGMANNDHYMWMLLLAVPMLKGPGKLSVDHVLKKIICKKHA
jgi:putative oxidoreductase